jgi:NAD(P)H-dependent FMN reductase
MSIIAVSGSYRKLGATRRTLEAAIEGAREAGGKVEVLNLNDTAFGYCRNCMDCWGRATLQEAVARCPVQDDLTPWIERLAAADGLILSSPVNMDSPTGSMKGFMERCAPLASFERAPFIISLLVRPGRCAGTRLDKGDRKVVWITASATPAWLGPVIFPIPKKQFKSFMDVWPAKVLDFIWVGGTSVPGYKVPERVLARARTAGSRLAG